MRQIIYEGKNPRKLPTSVILSNPNSKSRPKLSRKQNRAICTAALEFSTTPELQIVIKAMCLLDFLLGRRGSLVTGVVLYIKNSSFHNKSVGREPERKNPTNFD